MIETSSVLNGGKYAFGTAVHHIEQSEGGGNVSYGNATEEKFSDNVSTASEASESTGNGKRDLCLQGYFFIVCFI